MRILYVAMKYDYGISAHGYSFEHENFYDTLLHMGYDILYFDFMTIYQEQGREAMNRALLDIAKSEKPDLLFCFLFGEEIDREVMQTITKNSNIVTLNWFADDHWRFDNFSRFWTPCFTWVVTTSASTLPKYAALGYQNVIKSQWACNHYSYKNLDLRPVYDVTFIGKAHGIRRQLIHFLKEAGINIKTWGDGWESGRISQNEMVRVFNQSRINLNFSNASYRAKYFETPIWIVEKRSGALGRQLRRAYGLLYEPLNFIPVRDIDSQIKGRNFEIPGCGGFLLTDPAENLEEYYKIGSEIDTYLSLKELIDKIRYYLDHETEREAIAAAGYARIIQEHTYEQRFHQIFQQIGLE